MSPRRTGDSRKQTGSDQEADRSSYEARDYRAPSEVPDSAPPQRSRPGTVDPETPSELIARLKSELQEEKTRIDDLTRENRKRNAILEDMQESFAETNTCIENYRDDFERLDGRRSDLFTHLKRKNDEWVSTVPKEITTLYKEAVDAHTEKVTALEKEVEKANLELEAAQSANEQAQQELTLAKQGFKKAKEFKIAARATLESMEALWKEIQKEDEEPEPDTASMYVRLRHLEELLDSTKLAPPDDYADELNSALTKLFHARTKALETDEELATAQAKLDKSRAERDAMVNNKQGGILDNIRERLQEQPLSYVDSSPSKGS